MNTKLLRYTLYFFLVLFVSVSCDNSMDDVEVPSENTYFVESKLVTSYSKADISAYLTLASILYPEQSAQLEEILTHIESGVKVYKIIYNTEFNGEAKTASGIVCLPDQDGSYPILSYQNGTNTLHSAAPTVDTNNKLFQILEMMGSTGFIITLPDYLGFGEADDMFHPYLHKESTIQTVMDMLRAVEEMVAEENSISSTQDLYISGYSQGGWATMCLQKAIESQFSSEFDLKASACGAGPYDLTTINEYVTGLTTYPMPYFLGYIFNSYINLELNTSINDVLQDPYAGLIPTLYDGTKSGDEINAQLTTSMPDFFTADYISNWTTDAKFSGIKDMLEENSVQAYFTSTPTLLLHGTADDFVPPIVTSNLYADFITSGSSTNVVTLLPLAGATHTTGILPSGIASLLWFLQLKGENS
ncbi:lipase family protein [uncultured Draconibacterium sp.]|uniref:lipase family protein n=1 Tax=uncultured Draconibacterium sp. TaxID=1573823 RepID=UPI0032180090